MRKTGRSWTLAATLAASLATSPNGLAAPQPSPTPPPLPPDTVNQVGLRWNLKVIGTSAEEGATKPFRFSLCLGRYLRADEFSRPCSPSLTKTVEGAHDAPIVFSAGHGRFLPKGLGIDGNGVLYGDDPALLSRMEELPLCVRQLGVERCKPVYIDTNTVIEPDPIAAAIAKDAPKKSTSAAGKTIGVVALVGGAAAVVWGANELKNAQDIVDDGGGGGDTGLCTSSSQCSAVGIGRGGNFCGISPGDPQGASNVRCASDGLCHCCLTLNNRCQSCSSTSPCGDRNTSCIQGVCVFNNGARP